MEEFDYLKKSPVYDLEEIISNEFSRLKERVYLDHAATTLYSEKQIEDCMNLYKSSLFGNPHSRSSTSDISTQLVENVRQRILSFFNTTSEEYAVIFTSGATDSLRLIAHNFMWKTKRSVNSADESLCTNIESIKESSDLTNKSAESIEDSEISTDSQETSCGGTYIYTQENHTSVIGIGHTAKLQGSSVICTSIDEVSKILKKNPVGTKPDSKSDETSENILFAFPAQCNFTGAKYPLEWIEKIKNGALSSILKLNDNDKNWYVLLDAASFVSTSPLDLSKWKPDFVSISFYKIFGYPTGLGCLLVHKKAWNILDKTYFGGGTVDMCHAPTNTIIPRKDITQRFEDGTLPFLDIIALDIGFDTLTRITGSMEQVRNHVFNIVYYVYFVLNSLRHWNGNKVAKIYTHSQKWTLETQGSIINFNLFNSDESPVGFAFVEEMASIYNIDLRTGCMCSPGNCQKHLGIDLEKLQNQYKKGHSCGDALDIIDGDPTGSVRISFGYMSTFKDAEKFLYMIQDVFIDGEIKIDTSWENNLHSKKDDELLDTSKYYTDTIESNQIIKNNVTVQQLKHSPLTGPVFPNEATCKTKDNTTEFTYNTTKETNHENTDTTKYKNDTDNSNNEHNNNYFTNKGNRNNNDSINNNDLMTTPYVLSKIIVYPIKSCDGMEVDSWHIGTAGLEFDRKWMIIDQKGTTMTQRRLPKMCLIKPRVDLSNRLLHLNYPGYNSISIKIDNNGPTENTKLCNGRVCEDNIEGEDCGSEVSCWLSNVLEKPGLKLLHQVNRRESKLKTVEGKELKENISLANESQFLILHLPSVRKLLSTIAEGRDQHSENQILRRFRGNLVIDGGEPYEEDFWKVLQIESVKFQIQGKCRRCQMVGVTPNSGDRTKEPMKTLALTRGSNMYFGMHASLCQENIANPKIFRNSEINII